MHATVSAGVPVGHGAHCVRVLTGSGHRHYTGTGKRGILCRTLDCVNPRMHGDDAEEHHEQPDCPG